MSSVTDCRTYRCITWDSDHELLVMTMRLSLKAAKPCTTRHDWDSAQLSDPLRRDQFCMELQNRFSLLEELGDEGDSLAESSAFDAALTAAAKQFLPPSRSRRHHFTLSRRTQQLMAARQKAHQTWLKNRTDVARRARNKLNRQADRAVQLDMQRHTDRQAAEAQVLLQRRDMRGFSQAVKRMAGQARSKVVPRSMRDAAGNRQDGPRGVLEVLTAHFKDLLGGSEELSDETCNQMEAEITLFELQRGQCDDAHEALGDCPTIDEVAECTKALRDHAAPGEDMIDARLLKAGPIVTKWLHRVIIAVWKSGKAPPSWKAALMVPLYKNKGARDTCGNYRGISLLSIAGKVYATILLRRVSQQLDSKLHEAQCGFRQGRGTVDAMYTLRTVGAACGIYGVGLAKAYIDFTKAYDSINRHALWKVLKLYNVHPKLISLLQDLHSGTYAAVRLDGKVGSRFDVTAGVRQGCVIAPTLFNIFIDHVVRKALDLMLEKHPDCGIKIQGQREQASGLPPFERIIMLMYADDLVLMSHSAEELAEMLVIIDKVASEFGMKINAAKTEVQIQRHRGEANVAAGVHVDFSVSTGVVETATDFKYLGGWVQEDGSMDKEVGVRRGRGLGVFQSFDKVWSNKKLLLNQKMAVYNSFVLPHFTYGCETWNCTSDHLHKLETAHSACLRRIMGVDLTARHTLNHIRKVCGSQPVELVIVKRTFQWLGHVARMPDSRLPKLVYDCVPVGGKMNVGRPKASFKHTYRWMLRKVGIAEPDVWLVDMCDRALNREMWKNMVRNFSFEPASAITPGPTLRRSSRLQNLVI
jgi:Reverse transcriptase (RNA-dependent DNA polymerase)